MNIAEERYQACGRKQRYSTESAANEALAQIERREGEQGMRVYSCIWCRGYHLTSRLDG